MIREEYTLLRISKYKKYIVVLLYTYILLFHVNNITKIRTNIFTAVFLDG